MPTDFLRARAELLADVQEVATSDGSAFAARWAGLLERVEERDPATWDYTLGQVHAQTELESGPDFADALIDEIDDLVAMSWTDLHSIPGPLRGEMWTLARAVMSESARMQALSEGPLLPVLAIGDELARANRDAASRLSRNEKVKLAREGGLKGAVAAVVAERAKDASD